ncbi:MAG: response regulator [Ramlibacter sp.]
MAEPRVLLVDDEFSSAEVLGLILAEDGYHVTIASNGKQALERLPEAAPHVLVTDFMMPGMHGADLVKAVRAMPDWRDLPVLMISAAPHGALRTYDVKYDAFLRKPFGMDRFLETVRALVAAGRAGSPPS